MAGAECEKPKKNLTKWRAIGPAHDDDDRYIYLILNKDRRLLALRLYWHRV